MQRIVLGQDMMYSGQRGESKTRRPQRMINIRSERSGESVAGICYHLHQTFPARKGRADPTEAIQKPQIQPPTISTVQLVTSPPMRNTCEARGGLGDHYSCSLQVIRPDRRLLQGANHRRTQVFGTSYCPIEDDRNYTRSF